MLFSLAANAGACIVFWVLMSNFLYNFGYYINGKITFSNIFYNIHALLLEICVTIELNTAT